MDSLIIDLQRLTQFYFGLQKDLSDALNNAECEKERLLAESILQNRIRISQIERMNAHILQLSDDLRKARKNRNPKIRAQAESLVSEAKSHAVLIQELFARTSEKMEKTKAGIQKELGSIATGKRYLKSLVPVKNNYPKFIDSTG
jgi:hypothetical protein